MNHRRNHPRKQPSCTLCTPYRWRGNSASRLRKKEHEPIELPPHRHKSCMNANQRRRSLHSRIAHVEKKLARWHERSVWGGILRQMAIDSYERQLAKLRALLVELEFPG